MNDDPNSPDFLSIAEQSRIEQLRPRKRSHLLMKVFYAFWSIVLLWFGGWLLKECVDEVRFGRILTYDQLISEKLENLSWMFLASGVLTTVGAWGTYSNLVQAWPLLLRRIAKFREPTKVSTVLKRRAPSLLELLLMSGLLLGGALVLVATNFQLFGFLAGTITQESDLVKVVGQPEDIRMVYYNKRLESYEFTIEGYTTEYNVVAPKYNEVVEAVKSRRRVTAWFSTKKEMLLPRPRWLPLYQLKLGDQMILSYDDTVNARVADRRLSWDMFMIGIVFIGGGGASIYLQRRDPYGPWRWL